MSKYYIAIVFITVTTMITSIIHLYENETLSRLVKRDFWTIAILITTGTLCEYFGMYIDGTYPHWARIHAIIKAIEFSIAPIIPIFYVKIVGYRDIEEKVKGYVKVILLINVLAESFSIFQPAIFYIDKNNTYHHGPSYFIYIGMYLFGIGFFIVRLIKYTKKYQTRNTATLVSMLLFLIFGFSIRLVDSSLYLDWLIVSIAYLMFIIYYSDLVLKVDSLTFLLNRRSYENRLRTIDYETAIIMFDTNDFKTINDTYGHQCGDKVLQIIAQTILKVYGKYAYCYRIGGDEFIAIFKPGQLEIIISKDEVYNPKEAIDNLNRKLDDLIEAQTAEFPMLKNGISKGYAFYCGIHDPNGVDTDEHMENIQDIIKIADERMYEDKQKSKTE